MFKLIAIRPLTGCASHIHKCLRIGMMYYFCKDFVINESRTLIKRTSKNIKPLKEEFFSLKPLKEDFFSQRPIRPVVNISAIVGMNGDGKSSLIELMMRLVNNCVVDYKYKENHLHRIEDVIAELYYLVDDVLYRMAEEEGDKRAKIWKMADLKNQDKYEWEIKEEEVTNINENPACFFFTLISNYSLYAYKTDDYQHEWETKGDKKNDDEKCWLHYIFHENDSYLTPITIHPYREEGNIDINRENDLSRQRMLSLFLNAPHPKDNSGSFRRMNHKDAEILALTEVPYSHLQEKSIIDFFRASQNTTKLDVLLNQIDFVQNKKTDDYDNIEFRDLIDNVLPNYFESPLIEIMAQDEGFVPFVKSVISWVENRIDLSKTHSDIRDVRDRINTLSEKYNTNSPKKQYGRYGTILGFLLKINTAQLGRLDTIYHIITYLNISPSIVTKKFEELTIEEKCNHYKVYKILSVINTYSRYKNIVGNGDENNIIREYNQKRLKQCFKTIKEDIEKKDVDKNDDSHVIREIRQIDNFINKGIDEDGLYKRIGEKKNDQLLVSIDKLKEKHDGEFKLDELPPPIYNWNILFKREGETTCNIELNSFSSGEKQMLYSLSSIIYHLQNIDKNSIYPNVNLILEEIELYYHPECQRSLVKRLLEILRSANLQNIKNVNIVFVTHSPFILSDVPKCNVMFLQDGMGIDIMQENTFGANIHSLLKNGFFLPRPMGEFAYQKINSLFAGLNSGDFDRKTDLEDIYQQILLVGEPFLRNQLLSLYNSFKGH